MISTGGTFTITADIGNEVFRDPDTDVIEEGSLVQN
jgi:hypothetical protein